MCRFSDFQVNEIAKDGNVVHLRSIGMNDEPTSQVRFYSSGHSNFNC